jgi:molecular chaperone GrpE
VSADLPPGHISRVFRKPYKLHDRVIRHGQVIVAKDKE